MRFPMPCLALLLDAQLHVRLSCSLTLYVVDYVLLSWSKNEAFFVFVAGQPCCLAFVSEASKTQLVLPSHSHVNE